MRDYKKLMLQNATSFYDQSKRVIPTVIATLDSEEEQRQSTGAAAEVGVDVNLDNGRQILTQLFIDAQNLRQKLIELDLWDKVSDIEKDLLNCFEFSDVSSILLDAAEDVGARRTRNHLVHVKGYCLTTEQMGSIKDSLSSIFEDG